MVALGDFAVFHHRAKLEERKPPNRLTGGSQIFPPRSPGEYPRQHLRDIVRD